MINPYLALCEDVANSKVIEKHNLYVASGRAIDAITKIADSLGSDVRVTTINRERTKDCVEVTCLRTSKQLLYVEIKVFQRGVSGGAELAKTLCGLKREIMHVRGIHVKKYKEITR